VVLGDVALRHGFTWLLSIFTWGRCGWASQRHVSFWSTCKKRWPPIPVRGTELGSAAALMASGRPPRRLSIFHFLLPLRTATSRGPGA
jgi:hypothetical protein